MSLEDDIARGIKQGLKDYASEQRWKQEKAEMEGLQDFLSYVHEKDEEKRQEREYEESLAYEKRTKDSLREKYGQELSDSEIDTICLYKRGIRILKETFGAKKSDNALIKKLRKLEKRERWDGSRSEKAVTVLSVILFGLGTIFAGVMIGHAIIGIVAGAALGLLMYLLPSINVVTGARRIICKILFIINILLVLASFIFGILEGDILMVSAVIIAGTFIFIKILTKIQDDGMPPNYAILKKVNSQSMRELKADVAKMKI
ncbi:MAG: hypothetical protein LBV20_00790 [Treponema sp.]|jgi:hypothetical protein|nr:hypothetical protein [Treponema sp.]